MLEVHRLRHLHWAPTPVVALATSPDGTAVAAARESGAIEIWNVAPGSVGWYCQLTIPGIQDAAISSLIWCKSGLSSFGRLFSSGLDGFITEWDLDGLQPKAHVESHGGSVWHLSAQTIQEASRRNASGTVVRLKSLSDDSDSESGDDSEDEAPAEAINEMVEQQVAAACDDGSVRLFTVNDSINGMTYKKAFPRVNGRILSVAWSLDGTRVFAGGSDGCIRCWNAATSHEIYRITAGIGGSKSGSDFCIWSLLVLRNGTLVSGDSSGSTQFWDERGTLLQALNHHKADVLALVAAPSHGAVFSAGADGQVVLYQLVIESSRLNDSVSRLDVSIGLGDKWAFVGNKRAHSHDVRALAIAVPLLPEEGEPVRRISGGKRKQWEEPDHRKWARPGIPMLVSGGNDAKMFAYPANAMLAFHPHDVCPAPERTVVQLAHGLAKDGNVVMMAQHSTFVDIWRISGSYTASLNSGNGYGSDSEAGILGKRKWDSDDSEPTCNGNYKKANGMCVGSGNGTNREDSTYDQHPDDSVGTISGKRPVLLAKIKSKAPAHISCSAISGNGRCLAFSDKSKARLFELKHNQRSWAIKKKTLPSKVPAAHRMLFSVDSTRLIMACAKSEILVLDIESTEVLHKFNLATSDSRNTHSPATLLCASPDGQWLAVGSSRGNLTILNLETFRHHWSVPLFDGSPATAAVFHPGNNAVLIVTTAANKIHVLDIEARELGHWSKINHSNIPSEILEFPGGISGLTVSPSPKSTEIIAYSSRAMCLIDFRKPVKQGVNGNGVHHSEDASKRGKEQNGFVKMPKMSDKNFAITRFKDPVLFVGYVSERSLLIVERAWLEVLQQFPAPVFRHLYGT